MFGARRYDHGVVLLHCVGLAVDAHFQGAFHDHDQFVDPMGVEWRTGARFGGVQA